jgi:hypothetical protein
MGVWVSAAESAPSTGTWVASCFLHTKSSTTWQVCSQTVGLSNTDFSVRGVGPVLAAAVGVGGEPNAETGFAAMPMVLVWPLVRAGRIEVEIANGVEWST